MRLLTKILCIGIALTLTALPVVEAQTKLRDVLDIEGVRTNDLVGYGIVVGLNGTGDSVRNAPFTEDSLSHMLERLGVNVQGEEIRPNNVAAVLVTASLPAFARNGSAIDVSVASIGDAQSLEGGTLILTPLRGADNEVYAVAQGSVMVSGINVEAPGARDTVGTPTTGAIPDGALVEREIQFDFNSQDSVTLALRTPDFTTAARVEDTINTALGGPVAFMRDPGSIELNMASMSGSPARVLAAIENLPIKVETPARIVIDEKSGTIVLGQDVTISQVAIAQGNISIKVRENPVVVQPNPFANGETIVLPRTDIEVGQTGDQNIALLNSNTTLSQLIEGLNALGVRPQEMADIIRSMSAAGAIHAELVIR
ncbi:MAG: flagellar basal body P-ring protein FlgI [Hyphomonadaceae bacterium]|nr:flagellar basal body P-ring protein FlgI [Hyphomonadaceae bacterium]